MARKRAVVKRPPATRRVADTDGQEDLRPQVFSHRKVEWAGPLPPPAVLEGFEAAVPGSSKVIVEEFVAEAHHRREQEKKQGTLTFVDTLIGRATALAFAGAGFFITYTAIINDSPWVGAIIGGGMIVSGMTVLMKSRGK